MTLELKVYDGSFLNILGLWSPQNWELCALRNVEDERKVLLVPLSSLFYVFFFEFIKIPCLKWDEVVQNWGKAWWRMKEGILRPPFSPFVTNFKMSVLCLGPRMRWPEMHFNSFADLLGVAWPILFAIKLRPLGFFLITPGWSIYTQKPII